MCAKSTTIESFPPEILSQIFLSTDVRHVLHLPTQVQIYQANSNAYGPHSRSTGSHLGLVCRYWRAISMSTPALWASIRLEIGSSAYHPATLETLEKHLSRSKSHPPSISLDFADPDLDFNRLIEFIHESNVVDPKAVPVTFHFMKSILAHAKRIFHLSLHILSTELSLRFMPTLRDRLLSLTHIALLVYNDEPYNILNAFSTSPLRSIELFHATVPFNPKRHHLSYSNLTNILIEDADLPLVIDNLSTSTSLQSVKYVLHQTVNVGKASIPPLLHLRNLDLHMILQDYSPDNYTNFINLLTCPALTSLTFGMPMDFRSVNMKPSMMYFRQALTAFVKRSPRIRSFYLGYTEFCDEDVFCILKEMRELVLLSVAMTTGVNTRFMGALGEGLLVPKLKELRLDWYSKGFDWDAWQEMLSCRWELKECSLGSAYLEIRWSCVPEDARNWVRDRQQEGKAVRILCNREVRLEFYRYRVQEQIEQFLTT